MGSNSSKTGQTTVSLNHPKLQTVSLSSDKKQMAFSIVIDEVVYKDWKKKLSDSKNDPEYLFLPLTYQYSSKNLCGSAGNLQLSYDNYSYLLAEEIVERKASQGQFSESELWYLLLVLSSAQEEMKNKLHMKVGDIRPANVVINPDGYLRVINAMSWPGEESAYTKAFEGQPTYLSPEDVHKMEMGGVEDRTNFNSEVFSIGLTVLSAGMLTDFASLYPSKSATSKSFQFDLEEGNHCLNEWKSNRIYSQILTAFLSNLCRFEPQKRLTQNELWQWIIVHEGKIKSKQDFIIYKVHPKIENEVAQIRRQTGQSQNVQLVNNFVAQTNGKLTSGYPYPEFRSSVSQSSPRISMQTPPVQDMSLAKIVQSIYQPYPGNQPGQIMRPSLGNLEMRPVIGSSKEISNNMQTFGSQHKLSPSGNYQPNNYMPRNQAKQQHSSTVQYFRNMIDPNGTTNIEETIYVPKKNVL